MIDFEIFNYNYGIQKYFTSKNPNFELLKIDGLGVVDNNLSFISMPNSHTYKINGTKKNQRQITITLNIKNNIRINRSNLINVLRVPEVNIFNIDDYGVNGKGKLYFVFYVNNITYNIQAYLSHVEYNTYSESSIIKFSVISENTFLSTFQKNAIKRIDDGTGNHQEYEIANNGDIETGSVFKISTYDLVKNPAITIYNNKYSATMKYNGNIDSDHYLFLNLVENWDENYYAILTNKTTGTGISVTNQITTHIDGTQSFISTIAKIPPGKSKLLVQSDSGKIKIDEMDTTLQIYKDGIH